MTREIARYIAQQIFSPDYDYSHDMQMAQKWLRYYARYDGANIGWEEDNKVLYDTIKLAILKAQHIIFSSMDEDARKMSAFRGEIEMTFFDRPFDREVMEAAAEMFATGELL